MKYLYISLGILAACLCGCIASTAALSHYTAETSQVLTLAMEQAERGDYPAAVQTINRAMEGWEKHHGFFGIILRHDEADEVNTAFRALEKYAVTHSAEEFIPNCAELIARVRHLSDMELPHYYNIL